MSNLVAQTRFGLLGPPGATPGRAGPDFVLAQLRQPVALPRGEGLPDLRQATALLAARGAEVAAARRETRRPDFVSPFMVTVQEMRVRLVLALETSAPVQERLVLHWMNHFTVAAGLPASYFIGDMERTAIRPHMLGRFGDLLRASITHPAMLTYLSNHRSYGPNSVDGQRLRRGLNENLGRELLELHTLGVDGGYTQGDVVEAAKVLSGWGLPEGPEGRVFHPGRHEPGARTLLGRRYPEGGEEQLLALLDDLARHPATARHVTRRMVRHFLGETAPAEIAPALARIFLETGGDLRAVTQALVSHPASWSLPPRKLRPPVELVFSVARMLGGLPQDLPPPRVFRSLGQPWQGAPSPAGWPEEDNAWASPDAVKSRLDWALQFAARRDSSLDARRIADGVFGEALSAETRRAVQRAANGGQALALLVMSPDVQRR